MPEPEFWYDLKAARRLDRHHPWRPRFQPRDQIIDPRTIAGNRKTLTARTHRHVQPILRHIDANINRVHLIPSLRNRAC